MSKNKNTLLIAELPNGMRVRIDKNSNQRNVEMFKKYYVKNQK